MISICCAHKADADDGIKQGSAIKLDDIKRFEITEVYTHPDAKVDIILVHGLDGHPRDTWTADNGVFWPSQLLPKSVQARVLVYGYYTELYTFSGSGYIWLLWRYMDGGLTCVQFAYTT